MKQRKPLLASQKEYDQVQRLMDKIVKLNEKQLQLLNWRIQEFFRERRFVPVFLSMLEQNPPKLRKVAEKIVQALQSTELK